MFPFLSNTSFERFGTPTWAYVGTVFDEFSSYNLASHPHAILDSIFNWFWTLPKWLLMYYLQYFVALGLLKLSIYFGSFLGPSWLENRPQNPARRVPKLSLNLLLFLSAKFANMIPTWAPKMLPNECATFKGFASFFALGQLLGPSGLCEPSSSPQRTLQSSKIVHI